jgi:hypothetical protein
MNLRGRLHNGGLHNYTSPNIISVFKLRRMSWAGHVVHMGGMRNAYRICQKSYREEITQRTQA